MIRGWRDDSTTHSALQRVTRYKKKEEKKHQQSGFGIIIAKTRGACVIAIFWPKGEMGRNQDGLGRYIYATCWNRPCALIWAKLPVYLIL